MAIKSNIISNAGTDIFICPGTPVTDEQEHAVTCIMFCNSTGNAVTLDLHIVPITDGTHSQSNKVIHQLSIPAGETFTFDTEKVILTSSERIYAVASLSATLSAVVSSMRVS